MLEKVCMTDLKRGQRAAVAELAAYDDMRRRLQDIGLIEGTVIECLGKSPMGDPTAFLIRGAVIALRSEDSGRVLVLPGEGDDTVGCGMAEVVTAADIQGDRLWG